MRTGRRHLLRIREIVLAGFGTVLHGTLLRRFSMRTRPDSKSFRTGTNCQRAGCQNDSHRRRRVMNTKIRTIPIAAAIVTLLAGTVSYAQTVDPGDCNAVRPPV